MQRPESAWKMGWEKWGGRDNTVVCSLVCTVHLIRVMVVISLDCRTSECWFIHIKLREFSSLIGLKSVHVCAQISARGVSTSRNALLPLHLSQKLHGRFSNSFCWYSSESNGNKRCEAVAASVGKWTVVVVDTRLKKRALTIAKWSRRIGFWCSGKMMNHFTFCYWRAYWKILCAWDFNLYF